MPTNWPTKESPGVATIAPTGYPDSFGIWWSNFEAMENRGGYSGPYKTRAEATQGAQDWAEHWDAPIDIVQADEKPA